MLGDMKDPEGDLSYVINGSMSVVIAGFVLLNAALYTCLPMEVMRGSSTVSVVSSQPPSPSHALPSCSPFWLSFLTRPPPSPH